MTVTLSDPSVHGENIEDYTSYDYSIYNNHSPSTLYHSKHRNPSDTCRYLIQQTFHKYYHLGALLELNIG